MNNNVEPPPEVQPQPSPTSPDEVVNSMDVLSIHSEPNVLPVVFGHSFTNTTLPEDILMSEPSDTNSSSVVTSVSPEEYVKKFTSQRDRLTVIINNLQEENIQLLTTGDFSKLETNQKALSFAMNALDSAKKLLEPFHSINNKYIPSDKLPKINVDPTASALYQLTHREDNRPNATKEPSLDMFLREFERKLKDHNVSILDHWLQRLEVCFKKSDDNHHQDWFCRYIKKPVVELNQELTWDQAKALLKQKFDLASQTTPLMWIKHLVNFRQDCNESLTSALYRFRLFCVGAKVPLEIFREQIG
ncbi:hypothetical protein G6F56_004409 [Rhizopus delemar]|nr:hypothetical protein G6F56_004409 [Rhizopus delemar]